MADTNQNRRDDFGFADNDPFAELTRIMGHDPRPEAAPVQPGATPADPAHATPVQDAYENDFDIDLEKELMGEFDFTEFDQPQQSVSHGAVPEAPDQFVAVPEDRSAYAEPAVEQYESAYDLAHSDSGPFEPVVEAAVETQAHWEPEQYEVEAQVDVYSQSDVVVSDDAFLEAQVDTLGSLDSAFEHDTLSVDEQHFAVDADVSVASSEPEFQQDAAPYTEVAAVEPFGYADEPQFEVSDPLVADQDIGVESANPYSYDDLDLELEQVLQAQHASSFDKADVVEEPAPVAMWEEPAAPSAIAPAWHSASSVGAADASLEDELSALLADEAIVTPSPADMASKPAAGPYGRANFAAVPRSEYAPAPVQVAPVEPLVAEPQSVEMVSDRFSDDAFSFDDADFDFGSETALHGESSAIVEDSLAAAEPEDDFSSAFDDGFDLELDEPEAAPPPSVFSSHESPAPRVTEPSVGLFPSFGAASAYPAAASTPAAFPDLQPEEILVSQPVLRPTAFPAAAIPREEMPEVETVEVSEAAQAITDDLEIPDIDYGEPELQLYDDLESEITQALGVPAAERATEPAGWSTAAAPAIAAAAVASTASGMPSSVSGYATSQDSYGGQADYDQWQADNALADDGFDYETDLEQAIGMASYEESQESVSPKSRRSLFIAAAVAGVVAIGGAGLYAMSLFGGGSDTPALVRADGEPMKVRPENPGGTTVPNQDSQVYQRVAGDGSPNAPEQQNLITTAEEPIDITAQGQEQAEMLPPGVSSEFGDTAGLPKSEDRIAPESEPGVAGATEDVAAVAPRRVRTMVVRPDGTMVPRDEVAPAAAELVAQPSQETALAQPSVQQAPTLGQIPGMVPASAEDDSGPIVNTPATVSVVPTSRVEPQQNVAAAPTIQQPVAPAQQPAATPVSAPAAAAPAAAASSEWSMQIASQPTAEGAQTAYQDLARRYGNVLEGRGVNIVRADIEGRGTYYRVRIPAATRDEAIQLCTRYKSAGGSCFVSR